MPNQKIIIATLVLVISIVPSFSVISAQSTSDQIKLTKISDRTNVDSDSNNNIINYNILVENNKSCSQPVDVVLTFDKSGSMKHDGNNPPQPITDAKDAARFFIDSISQGEDQIGLVSYESSARTDSKLSDNQDHIVSKLDRIKAKGGTNIGEGIRLATNELNSERKNPNANQYIIIFTDGKATRPKNETRAKEYALEQASIAKTAGITIVSIGLGDESDKETLMQIASPSLYFFAPNANQLNEIYLNLSKSLQGVSPQTVVTDDLTQLLDKTTFISADNGGKLQSNRVVWELGDLACESQTNLNFKLRTKSNIYNGNNHNLINQVSLSNSAGETSSSNSISITYTSPKITISHTDNEDIAKVGDNLAYITKISNTGDGTARNFQVSIEIPDKYSISEISNGGYTDTGKIIWDELSLDPGSSLELRYIANVQSGFDAGYSEVNSTAVLVNNELSINSIDLTQVFVEPPPKPNFSTFVNCIELNDDDTFTGYFGYLNRRDEAQELDESRLHPKSAIGDPPQILDAGRKDKIFTANAKVGTNIVWITSAGSRKKTATASSTYKQCPKPIENLDPDELTELNSIIQENDNNPIFDQTINPIPLDQNVIIGTDTVELEQDDQTTEVEVINEQEVQVTNINDLPSVSNGSISTDCSSRRIIVNNCSASDTGGIETMQYSIDDGYSWYPINNVSGLGTSNATCNINTQPLKDSNYIFKIRARDNNNEWGLSNSEDINLNCSSGVVIGANHASVKGLSAPVSELIGELSGISTLPIDFKTEITGGPEKAFLNIKSNGNILEQFELKFNPQLNLWETQIITNTPGEYNLEIIAKESNGDEYKRDVNTLAIKEAPKLLNESTEVKIYFRANQSEEWRLWNAQSYNQDNPSLSRDGQNIAYVQKGQYYIEVNKEGYHSAKSSIQEVERSSYIGASGQLIKNDGIFSHIRKLTNQLELEVINNHSKFHNNSIVGEISPEFTLSSEEVEITNKYLKGKTTLLTTWNEWNPLAVEQMNFLKEIKYQYPEINIIVVNTEKSFDLSKNFIERGDYQLDIYKPNPGFYTDWNINSLPTNYLIDQASIIRHSYIGVVSTDEFQTIYDEIKIVNNSDN